MKSITAKRRNNSNIISDIRCRPIEIWLLDGISGYEAMQFCIFNAMLIMLNWRQSHVMSFMRVIRVWMTNEAHVVFSKFAFESSVLFDVNIPYKREWFLTLICYKVKLQFYQMIAVREFSDLRWFLYRLNSFFNIIARAIFYMFAMRCIPIRIAITT